MRLTTLGTGHAIPTARRASAGHLVEWSGGAALLDCSAGTYMRALKAGLDPWRLRAVVLSHFHPDHTGDLAGILWARRKLSKQHERPLWIVGPPGTADLLDRVEAVYGADRIATQRTVASYPFATDGLAITAFPAVHTPEAVCLRLTADDKVLAYSGDTADCPGLREACRGADLALLECTWPDSRWGHLSPDDCAAVLADAKPRRILLTHISDAVETELPTAEDGLVVSL